MADVWKGESYLYVIGSKDLPHVKIGISTNPQARLKQLQTSVPVRLEILWSIGGANNTLEQLVHFRLAQYRTHGEWFDLTSLGDPAAVVGDAVQAIQGRPQDPPAYCPDPEACWGHTCHHGTAP
ncbi:GIY-YIG nuclease family protein [Streptomyces sp. NPDC091972]|uniref:GIY-YIG nuclease family protein n=1 Tax=Streptomyces sp. NPDC091972 TaxID=3366007 RepID=UPI00381DA1BA